MIGSDWYELTCNRGINWGDAATWATAVLAAAAGWYAFRAYRLEVRRDDERREEALRAQAERVSIYWRPDGAGRRLVVHNLSDQPITQVRPYSRIISHAPPSADLQSLRGRHRSMPMIDIVGPRSIVDAPAQYANPSPGHRFAQDELERLVHGNDREGGQVAVGVTFTDASGSRCWDRKPNGVLEWTNPPRRPEWVRVRPHFRGGYLRADGVFVQPVRVRGYRLRVRADRGPSERAD